MYTARIIPYPIPSETVWLGRRGSVDDRCTRRYPLAPLLVISVVFHVWYAAWTAASS
jgi:hypothetical protein